MILRLRAWWVSRKGRTVNVDGLTLHVPRGVLNPVLFRSGAWFARAVAAEVARLGPDTRLLDLGCGSGVVGLLAGRQGARVTASDIDPTAVSAARENGLPDVRRGDLFEGVSGERFDLLCFNPPWMRGPRRGGRLDRALFAGPELELLHRFAAGVGAHIAPGGEAWVVLSENAPGAVEALGPGWMLRDHGLVQGERLLIWTRGADDLR
jgi:methylase of polypeptide subunit release factors